MSSFTRLRQQVAKSAKEAVKRKGKGAPAYVDDTPSNADAPRRWNDYTVHFEFPDPSDVGNSLIQLMDVDFKYPGRDDFGLQVIFVAAGCAESLRGRMACCGGMLYVRKALARQVACMACSWSGA